MKCFTTMAAMALTIATYGQDLVVNKVDEFTGKVVKKTKYYEVGVRGVDAALSAAMARVDDVVVLEMWTTNRMGCGGAVGNYTVLLKEDGSVVRLTDDIIDIECEERASSMYVVTNVDFANIKKIRFKQSDGYMDFEVAGRLYTLEELFNAVQ